MKKKENLVSVYATVSHLAFVIIAPLLVFIWGGSAAVKHFGLPEWVTGLCVGLGVIFMIGGAGSYLGQLIKLYAKDEKKVPKSFGSVRDNDYYDEYKDLHK